MGNRFSSGKFSIAECDRCGQRFKLKQLKFEVIKLKLYQLKVCPECWDPDQPQLQLGMYPVDDPQGDIQWGWNPVGGASQFDAALTPNYLVSTAIVGTVTVTVT